MVGWLTESSFSEGSFSEGLFSESHFSERFFLWTHFLLNFQKKFRGSYLNINLFAYIIQNTKLCKSKLLSYFRDGPATPNRSQDLRRPDTNPFRPRNQPPRTEPPGCRPHPGPHQPSGTSSLQVRKPRRDSDPTVFHEAFFEVDVFVEIANE